MALNAITRAVSALEEEDGFVLTGGTRGTVTEKKMMEGSAGEGWAVAGF